MIYLFENAGLGRPVDLPAGPPRTGQDPVGPHGGDTTWRPGTTAEQSTAGGR
ncbi:hypothetical protein AB0B25_21490 [Nocardia sp. NPDC049190]|uniref:hypothetical protein n=1 Tax=Nocardia sp. NPDC049190 TaxID=3155650 RepID=UPI0033CAFB5D